MKKAFTMIELIFVIVVIGILAAVAIPRLTASRTDAMISVGLTEIGQLVTEMSTEYTSKGTYTLLKNIVTDISIYTGGACNILAVNINDGVTYTYCLKNNAGILKPCINIKPVNKDGNLTISRVSTIDGDICNGIINSKIFTDKLEKTFVNGGSQINY
jgi:prepilin-type N-terminal cleavage/methylation domain-containing protein